jgi:hypothetical protein
LIFEVEKKITSPGVPCLTPVISRLFIAAVSRPHNISVMAEDAKASPAADGTAQKTRPEKPDQAKYEADLAAAQKEHNANMDKFVCLSFVAITQKQIVWLWRQQ